MPGLAIFLIVFFAILFILLIWFISTGNKLKVLVVKVNEAESGIDVALTKRYDLLTKVVASVKGYAKHEEETLTKIIAMRTPGAKSTLAEKQEFADATSEALKAINVVVEQYPTLKADTQFTALQNSIRDVEEQLQAARRLYNSNVSKYNQAIVVFPASIVANASHLTKRDFFEAETEKRQDVTIEF